MFGNRRKVSAIVVCVQKQTQGFGKLRVCSETDARFRQLSCVFRNRRKVSVIFVCVRKQTQGFGNFRVCSERDVTIVVMCYLERLSIVKFIERLR